MENSVKECSAFLYQRWPLEGGTVHPAVSHIGLKQKRKRSEAFCYSVSKGIFKNQRS